MVVQGADHAMSAGAPAGLEESALSACDREPIHVPGSVQPHGFLLAVSPESGLVVHASANVTEHVGLAATDMLGRPLDTIVPELRSSLGADIARAGDPAAPAQFVKTVRMGNGQCFDVVSHRSGPLVVLEFELLIPGEDGDRLSLLYKDLRGFVEQLQAARDLDRLMRLAASEIRRLTGYDRVLIYRFDESWSGTVIAEDRNDRLPAYLGLRFPASDIPAQARDLYRRNRVRIIPDADARAVPIEPTLTPVTGEPLDLSQSVLRAVSPVHIEYMRNMKTMSSLSISILRDGALWGLVSCHNRTAKRVPFQIRNGCDLLVQVLALQIVALERDNEAAYRLRLNAIQARLLAAMAEEERFIDGLVKHQGDLLALAGAAGGAIVSGDQILRLGKAPPDSVITRIVTFLTGDRSGDEVFATDRLPELMADAPGEDTPPSGLLSISISKKYASYILWFRPELVRTVAWGGDPTKPVSVGPDGQERLHPRKSFEAWQELVQGRAAPWTAAEIAAVGELRNAVVGIVLRRAEELASVSEELQRSNKELEAFSYSVSHDLRAPFRHIVGYAELLRKQESQALTERGRRYVDTIIESAFAAGTLVDSLLAFSQMGRTPLHRTSVNMASLVEEVRASVTRFGGEGRAIEWRVSPLGRVNADPAMLRLVVENLLSNAVKYTRGREPAVIEIGRRDEGEEAVFFVRDNGVGFDMAYVRKLFGVFQRLHRMEEFEGTGIGLANVKRIVERHGGHVSAEGAPDKGATFAFALPLKGEAGDHHG
jgi:light-regulated signal transduction histidine kinase (bacteriophytochrome)